CPICPNSLNQTIMELKHQTRSGAEPGVGSLKPERNKNYGNSALVATAILLSVDRALTLRSGGGPSMPPTST
ncbi:MAG: hypothetical protein L0Y74_03345, partial [candidate division Zixibacteria bacterium]|nr:hypothetical protein [candidate division Zixibacteria bacterium]